MSIKDQTKKTLKARDIERLENTSFASALLGGVDLADDTAQAEGSPVCGSVSCDGSACCSVSCEASACCSVSCENSACCICVSCEESACCSVSCETACTCGCVSVACCITFTCINDIADIEHPIILKGQQQSD